MKNLILIRHAKSSWNLPVPDANRQLEPRGINDARLVSKNCGKFLPATYDVYSSTANRAVETAKIFSENLQFPSGIIFNDALYTFDVGKLTNIVNSLNNHSDNVILFGHNAAITNFVNKFGDVYIENVPTCGFVSIQFDTNDWRFLHNGTVTKTIFPKDLK